MCIKTFLITINLVMFTVSVCTISYMAGVFKDNKRIAIASIPAECNMIVGSSSQLQANWVNTLEETQPVQLTKKGR